MSAIPSATLPRSALAPTALPWLVATGVVAAVALRTSVGGSQAAASAPAAACFVVALAGVALAAGWRPSRPALSSIAAGVVGASVLVALAVSARGGLHAGASASAAALAVWAPLVTSVAVAEEIVLRGVLFGAVLDRVGPTAALLLTSTAFALMHVPLYGASALPLDFAVGLWLGGLRLLSGGVAAPAIAHVLADLAGGWLL